LSDLPLPLHLRTLLLFDELGGGEGGGEEAERGGEKEESERKRWVQRREVGEGRGEGERTGEALEVVGTSG
jgi:hypothetical protein